MDASVDATQPITQHVLLNANDLLVRVETVSLGEAHWAETKLLLTDGADALTL